MIYTYKLIFLSLFIFFDLNLKAEYDVINAFPALSFNDPVGIYHSGDDTDRIFVVEQEGTIKVFNNNSNSSEVDVFLDITNIVEQDGGYTEEGLLGLAFHPNYSENGYFYVNYTRHNPRRNVIARYSVSDNNPNQADSQSSFVILEVNQPYTNHNGGQTTFGPDGYLYIIFGDGGSSGDPQGNGQNLSTLLGSLIRIDVDNPSNGLNYGIPPDNPFVDQENVREEIWCYGLRNPWRFSFDRKNGDLYIGDVGQSNWEEINYTSLHKVAGSNFGTGSSREHAPWGLQDWGFDAIISTNFADIFKNNCLNIGLLPVEVNAEVVEELFKLIQEDPKTIIEISVEEKSLKCSQISTGFTLDDFSKQELIKGQDQIDITLEHQDLINKFYKNRKKLIPNLD